MTGDTVTVITITRNRIPLLQRAIRSVEEQKYTGIVRHLIIIDDCHDTKAWLVANNTAFKLCEWLFIPRFPNEVSGPARSSKLRNIGVISSSTRWIAFLDDDNVYRSNHIDELIKCARKTGYRAVHSHRLLFNTDGTPYLECKFPWCRNEKQSRQIYKEMCNQGIFAKGSNTMRDRADPPYMLRGVQSVDTSEWLLRRDLLLEIPFTQQFTEEDNLDVITEDDKLLNDLVSRNEPIACTKSATLCYYLGGYSNDFR